MFDDFLKMFEVNEGDVERAYHQKSEAAIHANNYIGRRDELMNEFEYETKLNKTDVRIMVVAAALQCLRWALISNDFGRVSAAEADRAFHRAGNSEYMPSTVQEILTNIQVPYDAQRTSPRFQSIYPNANLGLGGWGHRIKTLGHDPIGGLLFGTMNIMTNTITLAGGASYHVRGNMIDGQTDIGHIMKWSFEILHNKPEIAGAAFVKQIVHVGTDCFTKVGLPLPGTMSLSGNAARLLANSRIDIYSVARGALLAVLINRVIEMLHRLFLDDEEYYNVRTMKVIMYSNVLSSLLNVGYVGLTKDLRRLDVGGLLVTLWQLLTNRKKIMEIEEKFVNDTLHHEYEEKYQKAKRDLEATGFPVIF